MELKNKTILITGSTDGIGKQTALDAAKVGAEVIIHGRDEDRIMQTIDMIRKETDNDSIFGIMADYTSLAAVNSMAKELTDNYSHIDILFNNAAELFHERILTEDGYERQFQVNYLAHFLLTQKLFPLIKDTEGARILNVSSMIHAPSIDFDNLQGEKDYSGSNVYALTKLLNILHTYKLGEILEDHKAVVHCLHTGVIETKLLNTAWSGGAPVTEGAANMIYAARSEAGEQVSGLYMENRRPMQSNPISYDKSVQEKLWNLSKEMLKDFL